MMRTSVETPKPKLQSRKAKSGEQGVTLSLAHYRPETECLSTWSRVDLKCFVGAMEKMRNMDVSQLRVSSLCSPHGNDPLPERFTRPAGIGNDHRMHKIRVDRSNAARMHGVIDGSVFYLVWLDRKHAIDPE
ncbi:MAG: hypothetical protein GW854_07050 [Erythrobacter sp.]|nr:hypothetical protein [Erythrobacter sp.]